MSTSIEPSDNALGLIASEHGLNLEERVAASDFSHALAFILIPRLEKGVIYQGIVPVVTVPVAFVIVDVI